MVNPRVRRWRVKDTMFADWRELAGEHTAQAIWGMRSNGLFLEALPLDPDPAELLDATDPSARKRE